MPAFRPIPIRRAAAAALAGAMILTILPAATMAATPQVSPQIQSTERTVLKYVNSFRAKNGVAPLRMATRVRYVARDRSRSMKNGNYFAHTSPSGVKAVHLLNQRGVNWTLWAENIGWTKHMSLDSGAKWMVDWWKGSPSHRRAMLTRSYNYAGVGIAQDGPKLLYTLVFVNQADHTKPRAAIISKSDSISVSSVKDVSVRWWGQDRKLSVRTAGLKGFTVQYKKVGGNWRTVLKNSQKRQITRHLGPGGHKYRVRSVDRRGNVGDWDKLKIYVNS